VRGRREGEEIKYCNKSLSGCCSVDKIGGINLLLLLKKLSKRWNTKLRD
jgi:hypothetical protein